MPFRCSYCHETGHLKNSFSSLLHDLHLAKHFLYTNSSFPLVISPFLGLIISPSPASLYGYSSPTLYDDLTKYELLYIQYIEKVARSPHSISLEVPLIYLMNTQTVSCSPPLSSPLPGFVPPKLLLNLFYALHCRGLSSPSKSFSFC